jgi:signal transduction histidine kinase
MLQEINRINLIVTEFMTIAKPSAILVTECRAEELVNNVVSLLHPQALLCNVRITIKSAKDIRPLHCEPNQIKQVLINVLKNAIEAMPTGGIVRTEVSMKNKDHILIRIDDQGKGIPKEKLAKVGDPFFTTKEGGTGLGLMVCQRIVQEHQGSMTIESEENKGTSVRIELPCLRRSK